MSIDDATNSPNIDHRFEQTSSTPVRSPRSRQMNMNSCGMGGTGSGSRWMWTALALVAGVTIGWVAFGHAGAAAVPGFAGVGVLLLFLPCIFMAGAMMLMMRGGDKKTDGNPR